ncbi:hypothetical protein [Acinetobacter pittii]|uniref:hypothetical protein n=1 Tax=Acinetobacter pittii TaxID=48296 RepID=UPI002448C8B3|nr:hypothetical protein [Acinetobacter pittii]MDH0691244.1 hypothetical protein [Acinetobacter pittii]
MADIDAKLGNDWASSDSAKERAVMITNVWLTNLKLPDTTDNQPLKDAILLAAVELIPDAVNGSLYTEVETGVLSETVSAQSGTSVSNTYSATHKTYTANENLALAILKPWLDKGFGNVVLLVKI